MIFLKFKNKSKFKNPEPTISELEDKLDIRNIRKAEHSKGRCHNYALKNYVISDCIKESMDKVLFILKTRFKEIKLNQIKKNDICCFFKKDKLCNVVLKHLGVIVKPSKDLTFVLGSPLAKAGGSSQIKEFIFQMNCVSTFHLLFA